MCQADSALPRYYSLVFKFIFIFLMLFTFGNKAIAEPYFNLDYINEEQGLESGSIESIAQDEEGYIWLGTQKGIYQFDGLNSKKYINDGKQGSLKSDDIYQIIVTENNQVWAATSTAGIAKFDRKTGTFQHLSNNTRPHQLGHFRAINLVELNDEIWVLTTVGIESVDKNTLETNKAVLIDSEGNQFTEYMAEDICVLDGSVWTVYKNQVYRLDEELNQFLLYDFSGFEESDLRSDEVIYSLFQINDQEMFINSNYGLYVLNNITKTIVQEPLNELKNSASPVLISDVLIDSNDTVWITTLGQGVYYRQAQQKSYSKIPLALGKNQLNTGFIYTIFEDRTKNLWLGTDGEYLAKFRSPQEVFPYFTNYYTDNQAERTYDIWGFEQFFDQLYLATSNGLYVFNDQNIEKFSPILTSEPYKENYSILNAGDVLYVGGGNGFYEFLPTGEVNNLSYLVKKFWPEKTNSTIAVTQLAHSETQLFLGTFSGLISMDKASHDGVLYSALSQETKLIDDWVNVLEYNSERQQLWVGTPVGAQVLSMGSESKVDKTNEILSQLHFNISDFFFTETDTWIATAKGLYRLTNENELLEYNIFPEMEIFSIEIIGETLWLSLPSGIVKAPLGKISNFKYFVKEDGLNNVVHIEKSSFYSEQDNLLYFGGDKGFVRFSPDFKLPEYANLSPRLRSVRLLNTDGLPEDITQRVLAGDALLHNENSIRFEYAFLNYKAPKKNRFQYKLEGFDFNWSELTKDSAATYTNLKKGNYVFRVKAYDANHVLSDKELSINFTIKSAWWLSNTALLVYIIWFLCGLYYFWKWTNTYQDRQKLQQLRRNKEEFITGYNRYALNLSELHSYQTMVRFFLDQVLLITGAKFVRYQQFLNESPMEITVGEFSSMNQNVFKMELMSNHTVAQLSLSEVDVEGLENVTADVQILFQQMIILQSSLMDKLKYNWNDYFSSMTGLYNKETFSKILADEFERAEKNNLSVVFFEWYIDKSRFRDNELLKRIQLISYGDQVKYVFGHHVIATFLERDKSNPRFLVFLSELDQEISDQYEKNLLRVIHENRIAIEESGLNFEKVKVFRIEEDFDSYLSDLNQLL